MNRVMKEVLSRSHLSRVEGKDRAVRYLCGALNRQME